MSSGCQEIEVYNLMTNATVVLDICNSSPYTNYLSTGLLSIAIFMMFFSCCLFTVGGVRVHKPLPNHRTPPSYDSV